MNQLNNYQIHHAMRETPSRRLELLTYRWLTEKGFEFFKVTAERAANCANEAFCFVEVYHHLCHVYISGSILRVKVVVQIVSYFLCRYCSSCLIYCWYYSIHIYTYTNTNQKNKTKQKNTKKKKNQRTNLHIIISLTQKKKRNIKWGGEKNK